MKKIGVIGCGVVGNAVIEGMTHAFEVYPYDKNKTDDSSLQNMVEEVDGPIFICLPTPMNKDGSANTGIIEEVLNELNNLYKKRKKDGVIVIKSTIPPGATDCFNEIFECLICVFNPEFLTEANAVYEFKNQDRIIIGGPREGTVVVKQMYQTAYPLVPTTKTSAIIAELVKYVTNCFLAVKVSFANEIFQICEKLGVDYDKVVEYSVKDVRLGTSHWSVPGPDGKIGWGGKCFGKDLNALMHLAKRLNVDPMVMDGAWKKNLEVRPEMDWEKIPGVITE